jgi:hypothetical protein
MSLIMHRPECKYAGLELTNAFVNDDECICWDRAPDDAPPYDEARSWPLNMAVIRAHNARVQAEAAFTSQAQLVEHNLQVAQVYALIAIAEALERRD